MGLHLNIKTDNAAFEDGYKGVEVCRILQEVANHIDNGNMEGTLRDINGNRVGSYTLE